MTPQKPDRTPGVGDTILGPQGLLAGTLPGYEARQPQMAMADLCESVLADQGSALVEAGTGTGKSFAYLIPALLSGQKVLVSTETIQLQEQLVGKDLPFLTRALAPLRPEPFRYAIAKGRGNYFCERNTRTLVEENVLIDPAGVAQAEEVLDAFVSGAWNGDKATLTIPVTDPAWADLAGEDSCTGTQCPYARTCPYLAAKKAVQEADLVVTNHTYYLLHHYVSQQSAGTVSLLPDHGIWIADEAHTLADKAVEVFGVELSQFRPRSFVRKAQKQLKALGVTVPEELAQTLEPEVTAAAERFFDCFRGSVKEAQLLSEYPDEDLAAAQSLAQVLVDTLKPVRRLIHDAGRAAAAEGGEDARAKRLALGQLLRNLDELTDSILSFFLPATRPCRACRGRGRDLETDRICPACSGTGSLPDSDPPVRFAEVVPDRNPRQKRKVTLHAKAAETRPIFQAILANLQATIYTSATLAIGTGPNAFAPALEELGLVEDQTQTMRVPSPFDYARQVAGYISPKVPEAKHPHYLDALADEVKRVITHTGGRAFVLFTSNRDMNETYARLVDRTDLPLFIQGSMPKDLLLEEFKRSGNGVLFGVKTFWTGVDIPGDALSCVILSKLPFPQVEHPLTKERCRRIVARGGSDFREFSLPRCIRDVLQGFGRLIRSKSDRGLFCILDSRMHTARYARTISQALPDFPAGTDLPDMPAKETERAIHPEGGAPPTTQECVPDPAGPHRLPHGDPAPGLSAVVQPDGPRSGPVPGTGPLGPSGTPGGGDSPAESVPAEPGSELDWFGLDRSGGPSGTPGGPVPGHHRNPGPPRPPAAPGADGAPGPRWDYLRAWVRSRSNRAARSIPGLTSPEAAELRTRWDELAGAWEKYSARCQWLADNQDHPDWSERNDRTDQTAQKFARLRDELALYAGTTPDALTDLLAGAGV